MRLAAATRRPAALADHAEPEQGAIDRRPGLVTEPRKGSIS